MTIRRVAVVGGGPGGLFASRLLARRHPEWRVSLYERLPPVETFGFGVGLSGGTLRAIFEADQEIHDDLVDEAFEYSTAHFRLPNGSVRVPGFHSGVAIGRARMLQALHRRAAEAGVSVHTETAPVIERLVDDNDLVIAADGVSSGSRTAYAERFGAQVRPGRGLFIWCGSRAPLDGMVFCPVATEHGLFVAHAYPYAPNLSTWVIETDEESWRRAGFDTSAVSEHGTDERAIEYLSDAFADLLRGHRLIGNKSQWGSFRTITCERWSHNNLVLLGDAAANAHPTLGSGTKLAVESAIALDQALHDQSTVQEALADYETRRRPAVERLQDRARRSQLWWESLGTRLHLTPERLAVAFLTRSGAVSVHDIASSAPELARAAAAQFADVTQDDVPHTNLTQWIVDRAAVHAGAQSAQLPVDHIDPWGPAAAGTIEKAQSLRHSGEDIVELVGADTRLALLDRLALAERIRTEVGLRVQVAAPPQHLDDVADGLISGRLDLTSLSSNQLSANP